MNDIVNPILERTSRQVLDQYRTEIEVLLRDYLTKSQNLDIPELLALKRKENAALTELLRQQARAMAWMAGEKIEPETHFGEGVLVAVSGVG